MYKVFWCREKNRNDLAIRAILLKMQLSTKTSIYATITRIIILMILICCLFSNFLHRIHGIDEIKIMNMLMYHKYLLSFFSFFLVKGYTLRNKTFSFFLKNSDIKAHVTRRKHNTRFTFLLEKNCMILLKNQTKAL